MQKQPMVASAVHFYVTRQRLDNSIGERDLAVGAFRLWRAERRIPRLG